jgi:hypothetical protein
MRRNIILKIFLILWVCSIFNFPLQAQEAPVQEEQPQETAPTRNVGAFNQFASGIYNYGFLEPVYYQFTGYSAFKEGVLPSTYMFAGTLPIDIPYLDYSIPAPSISWDRISQLDWDIPGGWSYGAEIHNYYATSETTYQGGGSFVAPDVKMDMHLWSLVFKLFILDPVDSLYQPYVGVSWGIINGSFDSTTVDGKQYDTSFYGGQGSRILGIQLKTGESWGGLFEFRTTTAYADTNNDPFNQSKSSNKLKLNFSGTLVCINVYYRY